MLSRRTLPILLLMLAGCSYQPSYELPDTELADQWMSQLVSEQQQVMSYEWWQAFESPELNQLIEQALTRNSDLLIATEKIHQAQAQLAGSRADHWPTLGLNSISASVSEGIDPDTARTESSSAGLSASYELDLWGRVAASVRSGELGFTAAIYDWESVRLSLVTSVADSWFQWLALSQRVTLAQTQLDKQQQQLTAAEASYRHGSINYRELLTYQNNVINQQNTLNTLLNQQLQARHALALLLHTQPHELQLPETDLMQLPLALPAVGLPADLLVQRPDIARAEINLAQADINVYQARMAYLPSFGLNAGISVRSSDSLLLADPVSSASLGASLASVLLLDGGARRAQTQLAESQRVEQLENYRKTLLTAIIETENALQGLHLAQTHEQQQQRLFHSEQQALEYIQSRVNAGAESPLALLDAERSFLQAEDQRIQQRLNLLNATLDVYKALGGGWERPDDV